MYIWFLSEHDPLLVVDNEKNPDIRTENVVQIFRDRIQIPQSTGEVNSREPLHGTIPSQLSLRAVAFSATFGYR